MAYARVSPMTLYHATLNLSLYIIKRAAHTNVFDRCILNPYKTVPIFREHKMVAWLLFKYILPLTVITT